MTDYSLLHVVTRCFVRVCLVFGRSGLLLEALFVACGRVPRLVMESGWHFNGRELVKDTPSTRS